MKEQRFRYYTLIFLMICLPLSTTAAPCSRPAKEGSAHTLSRDVVVYSNTQEFTWSYVSQDGTEISVVKCSVASGCTLFRDPALYGGTLEKDDDQYKSTLTIKNVHRDMDGRRWSLRGASNTLEDCTMEVYSFDSTPVCGDILVTNEGSTSKPFVVSWTCNVSNIYPSSLCQFYRVNNESYHTVSSNHINEGNPIHYGNPVYYSRSCTMNVPVSTLQPGNHTFKVTMYPNVTGTSTMLGAWLESDAITLSLPVASIKDCPSGSDVKDGYIKKGTTATCQCYLTDVGNLPGRPQWVNSKGQQMGLYDGSESSSLTVSFIKGDTQAPFTCRSSSQFGAHYGDVETYTPSFAYGPSHVSITLNKNDTTNFDFCEPTATFHVSCDISSDSVNPKPIARLDGIAANSITSIQESNPLKTYIYQYTVKPKTGGILTLKCVATNPIFPNLTTQDEGTITIQAPPTSPPVMSVDNGDSIVNGSVTTVISGQNLVVKCRVDGGYPAVSKITTICVGRQNVANDVETIQTLDVDKDMNQGKCSCMAEHVTGCYNETTEFTLNVQYIPTVTEFAANSQPRALLVKEGDSVTLSCKAKGNPRPSVSIRGQRSKESLTLQDTDSKDYVKTSDITKTMRCKDTDTYICMADNGVGDGVKKNVSVFVRCPPQLPSRGLKREFEMTNSTGHDIFIDIIGYPKPSGYTLTKVKSDRRKRRAVTGVVVDESRYNVIYLPKEPPEGTVVLRMVGLMDGDSGQYVLTIKNGFGELDFMFNVTIVPDIPTVTEYTANSQYQSLEVVEGDSVTLSCNAEGNPRPLLSIRGQRSNEYLTLQDTDSGDYTKTSEVTKTMRCKDTDTYICMADNGVGDGVEENVSVFVKCTPQLPQSGVNQEFEMTNATYFVIFIDIIGYPKPTDYTLTKVKSGRRKKRAMTRDLVDELLYSVIFLPKEPPEGTVVLRMVGLLDEDSGQYRLTIKNGVGEGLDFMFNVTIVPVLPESFSCDNESNMGAAVGVAVGCCLLLTIVAFIIGMQVGKRHMSQNKKPPKMLRPSPDYHDCNVSPLQEAYIDMDSIQLTEARQQRQQQQQQQQQQRNGGYEIQSHHGDNYHNHIQEYIDDDDGYETPVPSQDNTNPTCEYVDIDGFATVNFHSNNYINITPTSKPSHYINVSMT